MFRLTVAGVGRLKAGPERDLFFRYFDRAVMAGRPLGIAVEAREVDEGRARRAEDRRREEAAALAAALPDGTFVLALDETGGPLDSRSFAALLATSRDEARGGLSVVVGGPDGFDPAFRRSADRIVAFGAATWPHQLVRVMAAEQVYRALTIIGGHPYHRG